MRAVQRRGQLEGGGALLLDGTLDHAVDGEVPDHSGNYQKGHEYEDGAPYWFHWILRHLSMRTDLPSATSRAPLARSGSGPSRLAREEDQFPPLRLMVMSQDVLRAVVASNLEVPMVGTEPSVDDLGHLNAAVAQREAAGCLLAAVARVALDTQVHRSGPVRLTRACQGDAEGALPTRAFPARGPVPATFGARPTRRS